MSLYVDTHCHVDRFPDPRRVLAAAADAGVITVAVTELPSQFHLLATQLRTTSRVRVALGFHPLAAPRSVSHELAQFRRLLDRTDYVGEVGLDYSDRGLSTAHRQRLIFERILSYAATLGKVLTVHSRKAEKETIELLAEKRAYAILHWYSGPVGLVERAIEAGLYFSVNHAMTRSSNGRRIIEALPRERVVTETDAPFTRVGRRQAKPEDTPLIVAELAKIWSISKDEARDSIFETMNELHRSATAGKAAF